MNSEVILFINRILYLSGKIFMIPFLLIPLGLMHFIYKVQLETLIFDFTNPKELKVKRKNEILTINPKEVKSTSITIKPTLNSYNLSANWGLKIQFIKLENPCFFHRYTELFSAFEKKEKELYNSTVIKFVSREVLSNLRS